MAFYTFSLALPTVSNMRKRLNVFCRKWLEVFLFVDLFFKNSWLNVTLVSGAQHSDSASVVATSHHERYDNITMFPVLGLLFPWFTRVLTGSMCLPLSPSAPTPPWQASVCSLYLWVCFCFLFIHLFWFLHSTSQWDQMVFVFLSLISFTQHNTLQAHPRCCKCGSIFLRAGA